MVKNMDKAKKNNESDNLLDIDEVLRKNKELKSELEEKKSYIKELEELRDDLVKDAYRTIDLNSKLADSEEQLKSLVAEKDKFFSIIAHDLRNPIGNFKELTSILSENYDTFSEEEKRELIFELSKSSKQIYSLLENLLEWSRSQLGKIKIEPENTYLHQLVDLNVSLLKPNAQNKNITIVNNVDPSLIVFVDENTINTVIRNLLSNAIKFTQNGGKIIFESEYKKPYTYLKISDSGVGIPEDNIDKLFRVDVVKSTPGTNQEKGTGLGLILCKEFVEKNNGDIKVESKVGKGTTFIVKLPEINRAHSLPSEYLPESVEHSDDSELNESETQYSVPVDTNSMSNLKQIVEELEGDLYDKFNEVNDTMVISSIKLFIDDLNKLATKYNFPYLIQYSEELNDYYEKLDIDLITKRFKEYPKIIKYLKNLLD